MITIEHTHAHGTTLTGSHKGDGVWEICKVNGWRFSRSVGIYLRGSRDRDARRDIIDRTTDALRDAGHDVTVTVDNSARTTAEREADRADRADGRADRYAERANKAAAASTAARAASDRISDHIPFGQPILVGHHSEGRARRDAARIDAGMRKSFEQADKARRLAGRAESVGHNLAHRNDPRVTLRRIERLEAEGRDVARQLAGYRNNRGDVFTAAEPGSEWHEKLTRRAERIAEEISHWRGVLDGLRAAEVFVPWGPEHFRKGDTVNIGGTWYPVVRVNRKSVSVPPLIGLGSTVNHYGTPWSWTDTAPYDKVAGRRRDGMQLDAPNGQPWPLDLAAKVARWEELTQVARVSGDPQYAWRVRWARRLAHGLPMVASDAEVDAYQLNPSDAHGCRMLAAAYLEIADRLKAGESRTDIAASLPEVPHVEPLWVMPAGEPVRMLVRDLLPGDVVAGRYETGLAGGGERLVRAFVGPVETVDAHEGPEWSGERFVGFWRVGLSTGEVGEFRPWQPVAVHRADSGAGVQELTEPIPHVHAPAEPAVPAPVNPWLDLLAVFHLAA